MPVPVEDLSLSLVLPAYGEEKNLGPSVAKLLSALADLGIADYEIIIVDDGSADRTAATAQALADTNDRIIVVRHPRNLGYGAALATGFKAARKDRVFYTDADNQFDPRELGRLLALLPHGDIVAGFRAEKQYTLYRYLVSAAFNLLTRHGFGLADVDINCSFKIYPRELFERIELKSRHYFIDAEVALHAKALGYRTVQVSVTHFPRPAGRSKASPPRFILLTLRELLAARISMTKTGRP